MLGASGNSDVYGFRSIVDAITSRNLIATT